MRVTSGAALVGAAAVVVASAAGAQPSTERHRVEVGLQWSYLPLYAGDATVGAFHAAGATLRLGAHVGRGAFPYVEAFHTRTGRDEFRGGPRLQLFGLLLGGWTAGLQRGRVAALGAIGAGRLHADVVEQPPCLPPNCFAEGGGNFRDASLWTVAGDFGLLFPASRRVGIRGDVRLHAPVGAKEGAGDSGDVRLELAVGLSARL